MSGEGEAVRRGTSWPGYAPRAQNVPLFFFPTSDLYDNPNLDHLVSR